MFTLMKNKSGISEILAYVLLISISLSLAILVYGWLRFYQPAEDKGCPEEVSLVIKGIACDEANGKLTIMLHNKGLFSINGSIIRVNDREDAKNGVYAIEEYGDGLLPGDIQTFVYQFSNLKAILNNEGQPLSRISIVDIQPFIYENNKKVLCNNLVSEKLNCLLS